MSVASAVVITTNSTDPDLAITGGVKDTHVLTLTYENRFIIVASPPYLQPDNQLHTAMIQSVEDSIVTGVAYLADPHAGRAVLPEETEETGDIFRAYWNPTESTFTNLTDGARARELFLNDGWSLLMENLERLPQADLLLGIQVRVRCLTEFLAEVQKCFSIRVGFNGGWLVEDSVCSASDAAAAIDYWDDSWEAAWGQRLFILDATAAPHLIVFDAPCASVRVASHNSSVPAAR